MTKLFNKTGLLVSCIALSILLHILLVYALGIFRAYDFTTPVNLSQLVEVYAAKPADAVSPEITPGRPEHEETESGNNPATAEANDPPAAPPKQEQLQPGPKPAPSVLNTPEEPDPNPPAQNREIISNDSPDANHRPVTAGPNLSPLNSVGDFLATKNEKLTYLISMFGLPVGSAELEAKHEKGEIWLTLRVKSSAAISSVFPVDNIVETRHISGRFIMTKITQHEGAFKSDQGFTINLGKKRVTWFDNIEGRNQTINAPTDEVTDTLSGLYLLRSRQLHIGNTEMLHIFDSEIYAEVPVEILRRETVRLLNFTKIDTLVVRPLQKTAGFFRRTGDVLIWMTDDANKVPVKIVTSVALGTVTADLMSAESMFPEEAGKTK